MGGCQHLSQRKGAFFLLNKEEALSGLIQVSDDGLMCCQITTPGRSIKTHTTTNLRNKKNSEI